MKKAALVLADGSVYYGKGFGASKTVVGELVFSTGMGGYQEELTDPGFEGQILIFTFPLIGNYGINERDYESERIHPRGVVVREACSEPVHRFSKETLSEFLERFGVPGIEGIDTRAIVRKIREQGVLSACLGVKEEGELNVAEMLEKARAFNYSSVDFIKEVTCKKLTRIGKGKRKVGILDCGIRRSIINALSARGCEVLLFPAQTSAREILSHDPDGLLISSGPGNPALATRPIKTVRLLFGKIPIFGICKGHQIIAYAAGAKCFKLKFGHRGANHPVKEVSTGKVYITSQNHGFAIEESSLPKEFEITYVNCNDGTVEGIAHKELPIFGIQFHPEANPGPLDTAFLFDKFIEYMK